MQPPTCGPQNRDHFLVTILGHKGEARQLGLTLLAQNRDQKTAPKKITFSGPHLTTENSMMTRRARQIIVQRRIRVHVCSLDAACRNYPSICNDNPDTLGNAIFQKEEVATNNEEPQVRYLHWPKKPE